MSSPAGPGSAALALIAAVALGPAFASGAESSSPAATSRWQQQAVLTLQPGEERIVLLTQNGQDLAAGIVEASGLETALVLEPAWFVDGPDQRHGTEVLVVANSTDAPRTFTIVSSQAQSQQTFAPLLTTQEASRANLQAARQYMEASRAWAGNGDREDALEQWRRLAGNEASPLAGAARTQFLEGLMFLRRFDAVLAYFQQMNFSASAASFADYYLTLLRARALQNSGRRAEALATYRFLAERADALDAESVEQQMTLSSVLTEYGSRLVVQGFDTSDLDGMRPGGELIEQGLVLSSRFGDPVLTGAITAELAMFQAMAGDWDAGLNSLYVSESLLEGTGSLLALVNVKSNIAFHYTRRGLLRQAQGKYREALQMLEADPGLDIRQMAITYARLALTYKLTGDYSTAETYFEMAARWFATNGTAQDQQDVQLELGEIHRLRGRFEQALQTHAALVESIGARVWNDGWIRLHVQLAKDHLALGQHEAAAREVEALLAHRTLKEEENEPASRVPAYNLDIATVAAYMHLQRGAWEAAKAEVQAALATLADPLQESERQLELAHLLSVSEYRAGAIDAAIASGRAALARVETTRNQVDIRRQGATWNSHVSAIASHFVGMLLEQYSASGDERYFTEAFDTIQRVKAVNLRQSRQLAALRTDQRAQGALQELWQDMIADKRALLASLVRNEDVTALQARAARSEEAYRSFRSDPAPAELPPLQAISLAALKAELGEASALLFIVGEERGHGIEITRDSHRVFSTPGRADLARLIDAGLAEFRGREARGFPAATDLADVVFGQLLHPAGDIYIEPDGVLSQVPFAALPVPGAMAYTPLAAAARVTNVPSLSEFFTSAPQASAPRLQAAVFADPAFDLPESPFELVRVEASLFDSWRNGLKRLPFTAVEATRLLDKFPAAAARAFQDDAATVTNLFLPEIRSARILHMASHGFSSREDSDHVGFLLAGSPNDPASGFLTIDDIESTTFANELVVISGCETGIGEVVAGEGMLGLSRAFLSQGAKAVMASLWPVSDRATALFMQRFYEGLLDEGLTPPAALQWAQMAMLRDPMYRHPLYWGAFTLAVSSRHYEPVQAVATTLSR